MNREDIISMAHKSHLDVYGLGTDYAKFADALERFAELARADEREWRVKCDTYINLLDANAKELDRAMELLRRAENEMRYAGWTKFEMDNPARNGVYEQIKRFLK